MMTLTFNRDNKSDCPCCGCADRAPGTGCHDRCERYREWRDKVDEKNKAERAYKQSMNTISEAKRRELWRSKRYSRMTRYTNSTLKEPT